MGTRGLKKFKKYIRVATVEDRLGIQHKMNIRTIKLQLGLSELSCSNYQISLIMFVYGFYTPTVSELGKRTEDTTGTCD